MEKDPFVPTSDETLPLRENYPQPTAQEWAHSDQIGELAAAIAAAQGKMTNASLNKSNPYFGSRYADLAEIRDRVMPAFSEAGVAVLQFPFVARPSDGVTTAGVVTVLTHKSGQWARCTIGFRPQRGEKGKGNVYSDDPQACGSAITYARRYALAALGGISADEDDDANTATHGSVAPRAEKREAPVPAAKPASAPADAPPAAADGPKLASEKQVACIHALASQCKVSNEQLHARIAADYKAGSTKELTSRQASEVIERLKTLAAKKAAAAPETATLTRDEAEAAVIDLITGYELSTEDVHACLPARRNSTAELDAIELQTLAGVLRQKYGAK